MQFVIPVYKFEVDMVGDLMSCNGSWVGFDHQYVVWRFGFGHGSPAAKAYGISTKDNGIDGFVWILADFDGNEIEKFHGIAKDLPSNWKAVLDAKVILVAG